MSINYQKKLEEQLETLCGTPRLLLHACCAPCSSYVLEYLSRYFAITLFFYNPNIDDAAEYRKREAELARLAAALPHENPITFLAARYDPAEFFEIARGLEAAPEGGARCMRCYELRLAETAQAARDGGFDYFTTTLSISPHKNAEALNQLGERLGETYGISYLYADFKKRGGYQRSIVLSREYSLYRQNFCGCRYSRATTSILG